MVNARSAGGLTPFLLSQVAVLNLGIIGPTSHRSRKIGAAQFSLLISLSTAF
jgi:hypothetical protein